MSGEPNNTSAAEAVNEEEFHVARDQVEAYLDLARYDEEGDREGLMQYLSAHPEEVDVQDAQGRTALHMAAANGHMDVVRLLLSFHPKPEVANVEGNTALHFAALNNHLDTARALLEAGWKSTARNKSDRTPLGVIIGKDFQDMEALLLTFDDGSEVTEGMLKNAGAVDSDEDGEGEEQPDNSNDAAAPRPSGSVPQQKQEEEAPASEANPEALIGTGNVDQVE